jgi:hypothetical protein
MRKFTQTNQYSCKNHILSGITLGAWLKIIRSRFFDIEWFSYFPRILFLTFMACITSCVSVLETVLYGKVIESTPLNTRPLFILGHPRTGTTLLHNVMSRDKNNFIYCR